MPNNTETEQEFNPRHRIVGAIIIVTLAVIVVPLILDKNEWQPRQPGKTATTPPVDTKVVVTRVEDLRRKNEKTVQTEPVKDESTNTSQQTVKQPETAQVQQKAVVEKKIETVTEKKKPEHKVATKSPETKPAREAIKDGWVVQLGTFANQKNVERMRTQLSSKGYKVSTETVQLASGPATRVRVGPYGRKSQAESMRKRIETDLGLKGSVLAAR